MSHRRRAEIYAVTSDRSYLIYFLGRLRVDTGSSAGMNEGGAILYRRRHMQMIDRCMRCRDDMHQRRLYDYKHLEIDRFAPMPSWLFWDTVGDEVASVKLVLIISGTPPAVRVRYSNSTCFLRAAYSLPENFPYQIGNPTSLISKNLA